MPAAGFGVTVTITGFDVCTQPEPEVTVTLYVPGVLTVIERVVSPVDQRKFPLCGAVSVTLPPWQNVVGPDGVILRVWRNVRVPGHVEAILQFLAGGR